MMAMTVSRLAMYSDLTGNELDFATNYGVKYRMGREG